MDYVRSTCMGKCLDRETAYDMTVAIYALLPLQNHGQDTDLRKQISNCWDFCNEKGWKVKYVLIGQCRSGDASSKLESNEILKKARAENLDFVVFWELRLSKVDYIKVKSKKRAQATRATVLARAGDLAETKSGAQRI